MSNHLASADMHLMSVDERLLLIEQLWDSLDADAKETRALPEWQEAELERRLDALESGTSIGAPWNEVRRRITGAR